MIVIDSSALIAILENEPEQSAFLRSLSTANGPIVSAINYQETGHVVFSRRGALGIQQLDELLRDFNIEIVPHDADTARLAVEAFQKYGKGIHPRARLNLGDCAAYALSNQTGAPLLFKGNDFAATDIAAALPAAP